MSKEKKLCAECREIDNSQKRPVVCDECKLLNPNEPSLNVIEVTHLRHQKHQTAKRKGESRKIQLPNTKRQKKTREVKKTYSTTKRIVLSAKKRKA